MGGKFIAGNWKCIWSFAYFSNVLSFQRQASTNKWTFSCAWRRHAWRIRKSFLKRPLWNVSRYSKIPWPCLSPVFMCLGHISWRKYFSIKKCPHWALLSYETLSGGRDFKFEAISDLTADMSFQTKHSTLLNIKRKSE